MAKRFAEEYGLMRLTVGEAVRHILELQPGSELAKTIKKKLIQGQIVPDELGLQALAVAVMDIICHTRGYNLAFSYCSIFAVPLSNMHDVKFV